jgi:adenine-specific DNA-methyltransferase
MKYMGSKRELLEQIEKIVSKNLDEGKVILDIFSGTCGVGIYLRDKYPVYSNDIQHYSRTISKGAIEAPPTEITKEKIWSLLEKNYNKNFEYLTGKLDSYIKESNYFLEVKKWDSKLLDEYQKFLKTVPYPTNNNGMKPEGKWLIDEYHKKAKASKTFPYFQTVSLFSEMYFGIEQAISIDSLKYAIDNLDEENKNLASILDVALMHAYSYTSAGTGHFAQFRDLSTISSVTDVFLYRTRSVSDYFFKKAEELIQGSKLNMHYKDSKSFALDYRDLITDKNIMSQVGFVYADPPYSFVHYSRFYHAVEDLCRYDYPVIEHKGRYRTDRHQSPFCIKTQAPGAFKDLLINSYKYHIPVLISYSNTGMIKLSQVIDIAKETGYKTELLEMAHKHSTMGRLKDKDRDVTEALLLCY